jgi:NodT family efflux transporter outer membrane factor (OMF) lipoprotein
MNKNLLIAFFILINCLLFISCAAPKITEAKATTEIPTKYKDAIDTSNMAKISWNQYFNDSKLICLIDTALQNNLDVLMTLQEIEIAKSKVRLASGKLLPSVNAGFGAGVEKVGRYTSQGAGDASADITPGQVVPDNLTNIQFGFQAGWEADIWGKLKNAKKSAYTNYLSSIEGKKWVTTNLIAEVANSYYDLVGLHAQLNIIKESIDLQNKQLEVVKLQKEASLVTELAVKQFEALLYNAQNQEFNLMQNITETENKLNLLLGRYSQKIEVSEGFTQMLPTALAIGIPSQLLKNRPDIQQAALALTASKLDVKVAEAEFYPSLNMGASIGLNAFKTKYLFRSPESIMYSLITDVAGPLINRSAIQAEFANANALQIEAAYQYQKTILNGFLEVANQVSNVKNLQFSYQIKSKEADALAASVQVSSDLFKYAKANYLEVLSAQRESISTKLELVEIKKQQYNSITNLYKSLGGGWQ